MNQRSCWGPRSLTVAVFSAAVFLLAACGGSEEREADYIARGKELYTEGNFTKASLEFRNALQINSNGVEATYYLALISERRNDLPAAFGAFKRVLELDPKHLPALIKVGQYTLAGGQVTAALESAERALTLDPANAEAFALRAAVKLRQGSLADAEADVGRAAAIDAQNLSALAVLVGIRNKQGREPEALQLLDAALAQNPNADGLRAVKLQLLSNKGDLAGIETILREQISRNPHVLSSRIELARLLTTQGRKDEAEQMLRDGVTANPDDKELKLLLSQYLAEQRSPDLAATELQSYIAAAPEETAYRFALSSIYLGQRKFEEARNAVATLADPDDSGAVSLKARTRLAEIAYREGKVQDAEAMTTQILTAEPENADALLLRSTIRLDRKDNQNAIIDLRSILRTQPQSLVAMTRLAKAYAANGDSTLAIDTYRNALTLDPSDTDLRLELIEHLRSLGRESEARAEMEKIDDATSAKPEVLYAKAESLIEEGRLDRAEEIARRLLSTGNAMHGHTLLGRILHTRGTTEEALAEFRLATAADPRASAPMTYLVAALSRANRVQDAATYLEGVIAADPQNATALALAGDVYFALGRPADAENALRASIAAAPAWEAAYLKLGSLFLRQGKTQEAAQTFRAGLERIPEQVELMLRLGMSQEQLGDYDGALASYETVLQREPAQTIAQNNMAALTADIWPTDPTRMEKARRIAEGFRNTNQPLLLDTLGWIQLQSGNVDDAIALLERAVRAKPDEPSLRYHLGRAYLARGDKARAKPELELAVASNASYRGIDDARQVLSQL